MHSPTIFLLRIVGIDFCEVNGNLRLRNQPVGLPGRRVEPTPRRELKKS
ncbi:MAG: hypothetical protein R6T98_09165 [Desulfatiglandales bacterium]